jgi:transposase
MDQVHVVRHKVRVERVPVRRVARELGISRNTIRRYLKDETPIGERRAAARPKPVAAAVLPRLEVLLEESSRWTAGKQRLTATRLHELLRAEGLVVGATLVKTAVREWRRRRQEVFVPLTYRPGELAEVDFFEVLVDVGGERRKTFLFVMRLMFSGRDFAWLYDRQDQISFLDGHVRAFAHFGFVPRRIVYDNLKPAVRRLPRGSARELTERFQSLVVHYVFEPCFARPRTGHDKGGVEARGKAIRHQEMVPIPSGQTLEMIAAALLSRLDARFASGDRASQFGTEREHALDLPTVAFDARAVHLVVATRQSLIRVEGACYSVPAAWAGLSATAFIGPSFVEVVARDGARVQHPRRRFGQRAIDYRHYLPELAKKPQALRQVAPDLMRNLGEPFAAAWRHLVEAHGALEAARAFAKVLAIVIEIGLDAAAPRIAAALRDGEPLLIALRPRPEPSASITPDELPEALRAVVVEPPSLSDFEQALGGVA